MDLTSGTTGRTLVLFEEGAAADGLQAVQEATGVAAAGAEYFETLGVAVYDSPPDQVATAGGSAAVLAVEPERIVYALEIAPPLGNGHAALTPPLAPPTAMAPP